MTSIPPTNNLVGAKLGNYRLERLLGRGRMGLVYLARDEALLRPIALKLLAWSLPDVAHHDPEAWLLTEARNIARVSHPAVIQVYGVARHGPHAYIAMEYVDGISADRVVAERGPFPPTTATQILLQIAGALQAAHECGVIHRDVKPANILIRADGSAKLGDFGMAIHRKQGSMVSSEQQVGTPLYTAPELWSGSPATPATDIYALGATYHFLLTGHPPFEANDLPTLIEAHRHAKPQRLAALSGRLPASCLELVRRCLAKSPEDRPASAQELSWLARSVIRSIDGWQREARRSTSSLLPAARAVGSRDSWHHALGLTRPPFSEQESAVGLAPFPSFQRAVAELRELLSTKPSVIQLRAPIGASGMLRELFRASGRSSGIIWLEADSGGAGGSITQRACRAFGALPSTQVATYNALEGLIEHLAGAAPDGKLAPLLVIEVPSLRLALQELEPLLLAARATSYFSVAVVAAEPELTLTDAELVEVPAFRALELLDYLRAALAAARSPTAPPLLVTPDAALLLHHETKGNLAQINRLAARTLELAAQDRARIITSWHVWAAARRHESPSPPTGWPSREVIEILNAERRAVGFEARVVATPADVERS